MAARRKYYWAAPEGGVCNRFRPHLLMVLAQLGYTFLYVITEASFNHGMNPHVYVTYRHIVATLVMWPFAYFLERKIRPKMTWALFLEINVLSLLGVSLTLNMYFASLRYTSPTFVASMVNTIASLTFIIAILLRMESLDVKNLHGMAKVAGTVVSLAGVTTMTLYKGPAIKNLWGALIHLQGNAVHESWVKGSILTVASCVTWSIWYVMQAVTLKKYPAQLSLTTWMSFLGSIQSAVFTVIIEHKPQAVQALWPSGHRKGTPSIMCWVRYPWAPDAQRIMEDFSRIYKGDCVFRLDNLHPAVVH